MSSERLNSKRLKSEKRHAMQFSAPMTALLLALVLRWALELVLELVLLRWALVLLLALELVKNEQARCAPLPKFAVPMSGSHGLVCVALRRLLSPLQSLS